MAQLCPGCKNPSSWAPDLCPECLDLMDKANFYKLADEECPSCGATPAIVWRSGGAFHQRTECMCGRVTRWVACGHDAEASPSDAEIETV